MRYLFISQTAEKWGIKQRRIRVLCQEGRIPRVYWSIPEDVEKPKDERIKFRKYVKEC